MTSPDTSHLVRQQAALHRVASMVARQRPAAEVFAAVTREIGELLDVEDARLVRFEVDETATILASWGLLTDVIPNGTNQPLAGESALGRVHRSGRAARLDDFSCGDSEIICLMRRVGVKAAVAAPIVVHGVVWGAVVAATVREDKRPLPLGTEHRIAQFAEFAATSINTLEIQDKLAASRARIVRATDAARRQFERDLHDGVQQRLVTLALKLGALQEQLPPELVEAAALLADVQAELAETLSGVQELARGIHPAILSGGGLVPALRSLARRSPIPISVDIAGIARLDERVEVAAYYVVLEAVANTCKHAGASAIAVTVRSDGTGVELTVADDGGGGADPALGSGLVGLVDRVEAIGGSLSVDSPNAGGTTLRAVIPAVPACPPERSPWHGSAAPIGHPDALRSDAA